MKKLINTALVYLIAGAAAGVFFREFTNFAQFTGQTTLGLMHPHLLVLGFAVFLIATLFALQDDFTGDKLFKPFYIVYNVGLVVTVCTACDARRRHLGHRRHRPHPHRRGPRAAHRDVQARGEPQAGNARLRARLRDRPPRSPPTRCWRASSFWRQARTPRFRRIAADRRTFRKPAARRSRTPDPRARAGNAARQRVEAASLLSRPLPACA